MSFPTLQLTDAGRSIIVSALAGGAIVFTKVGVGNGERPADINEITELVNPVKTIGIGEISKGDGCANITAVLDNANLVEGYWWREIGIYAKDSDDNEVIYAYAHAGEHADYIPAYSNTSYLRTTMNITVVVGSAENVSAVINEYIGYVTTETYESHLNDYENPHKVTKEQIGLENVENLSIDDQTPNIEFGVSYETIQNGEKMKTILGKIRLQMNRLISHLSSANPHKITCSTIGAATSSHPHAATDITSGTLPISRGGTGGTTAINARKNLGMQAGRSSINVVAGELCSNFVPFNSPFINEVNIVLTPELQRTQTDLKLFIQYHNKSGFNVCAYSDTITAKIKFSYIAME
ncbi:phage tail protein [uncultured Ruminococcus sp.]|uniref:phage tail-collar fiber domain-containing protein n=1 Tax=uncultured Ruminococcus sp. TaxID=165186 RepID=UPI0025FBEAFE|nr:phage tail protein [uncultured Ruminococcus sp.]